MKKKKPETKHIYFDLGWVIIPVKKDIVAIELAKHSKLSLTRIKKIFGHAYTNSDQKFWQLVYAFDRGELYPVDFYWKVCQELQLVMSFREFARIWQMMLGLDERFIGLIEKLRSLGVRTGIISDLCIIHYNRAMELLDRDLFDICFFSFMEKVLKADKGSVMFERAIRAANFPPENILFIDDREANIDAAKRCGLNTFLYKRNFVALTRYMRQLGLDV